MGKIIVAGSIVFDYKMDFTGMREFWNQTKNSIKYNAFYAVLEGIKNGKM